MTQLCVSQLQQFTVWILCYTASMNINSRQFPSPANPARCKLLQQAPEMLFFCSVLRQIVKCKEVEDSRNVSAVSTAPHLCTLLIPAKKTGTKPVRTCSPSNITVPPLKARNALHSSQSAATPILIMYPLLLLATPNNGKHQVVYVNKGVETRKLLCSD